MVSVTTRQINLMQKGESGHATIKRDRQDESPHADVIGGFRLDRFDAALCRCGDVFEVQRQGFDRVGQDFVKRVGCRKAARHLGEMDAERAVLVFENDCDVVHGVSPKSNRPVWRYCGPTAII